MADTTWPDDALEVGRIGDAWGLKGWFWVHSHASPPEALRTARRWHLRSAPKRPVGVGSASLPAVLDILEVREHGDGLVALAEGIDDRTGAERLHGALVFVARRDFPSAGPDEFYWTDLLGMETVNRQGVVLGTVIGLIDTGPHSVLRVHPPPIDDTEPAAEERLIPFVAAYVDAVDLPARRITVDWGLDF